MGTYPYSLVGVYSIKWNRVGVADSLFSQQSDSVVRSGAKGDN
jgi:hypothetical protein